MFRHNGLSANNNNGAATLQVILPLLLLLTLVLVAPHQRRFIAAHQNANMIPIVVASVANVAQIYAMKGLAYNEIKWIWTVNQVVANMPIPAIRVPTVAIPNAALTRNVKWIVLPSE
ncbi:uncharacterized protein [Eurosta solidaginis]|uniref:uncharacterized protein isoform X2 n=1 Tax=Eurosta solidaginis TaxID=178769 RepID=UPI003530CFC4